MYVIAMYDIDDNLIKIYSDYKECAKDFGKSLSRVINMVTQLKCGNIKKVKYKGIWVKLYKYNVEEE